jgi:hypothetical protein
VQSTQSVPCATEGLLLEVNRPGLESNHFYIVRCLKISGAVPLLPPYAFVV